MTYDANLDGILDVRATARTWDHKKFRNLTTRERVDNQLFRFFGCHRKLLDNLFGEMRMIKATETGIVNRLLLEISGVSDEQNSLDVEAKLYRGSDQLVDSNKTVVPWQSQRVYGKPLYHCAARTHSIGRTKTCPPLSQATHRKNHLFHRILRCLSLDRCFPTIVPWAVIV